MPDYKKMYFHMFHELEKATRILTEVQQECEEMYISAPDAEIITLQENRNKQETAPDE